MTKQPQLSPRRIIERPRLVTHLEQSDARTILLVAPAGYGKTTLLRQWAARNGSPPWYAAESGSSDLAQLSLGLAHTLEASSPGLSADVEQVLTALSNPRRQLRELVHAFRRRLADVALETVIIDDYHLIAESSAGEAFVHKLFSRTDARLLIASRVRPSWASARTGIYGELLEVGSAELALTPDETADILADSSVRVSNDLLAQADGWPAVIGLAALAQCPHERSHQLSATLFRFFAEELFTAAPGGLQGRLVAMSVLPTLSRELMVTQFGDDADSILADAVRLGFATQVDARHDLHPLIREYLFAKVEIHDDAEPTVTSAVELSLRLAAWDHAFALVKRFERVDLIDRLLESAFIPLTRMGRVGTLEQVRDFARAHSADFAPTVTLIEAELDLRDGLHKRAKALALRAVEGLGDKHILSSHAHSIAARAAYVLAEYTTAARHFRRSRLTAQDDADTRSALWGLMVTSVFSETFPAKRVADELQRRRNASPTDLVLATNGALMVRRYSDGFANEIDIESAMHALAAVPDPLVRTSFTNNLSYEARLAAKYERALDAAKITLDQAEDYQLSWVVLQAQWLLAAASLGVRDFGRTNRWLSRLERIAVKFDDTHLTLNAAVLRARVLLALQKPQEAQTVLAVDTTSGVNPAMRAEVKAMQALVLAVLGFADDAADEAEQAAAMTRSVEVRAFAACAHAVCQPSKKNIGAAFSLAKRLEVWDPLVCAIRAHPPLLMSLATTPSRYPDLQALLQRSQDFDLARQAGITLYPRPKTRGSALSPREREVFELVRNGLTNKEIGQILFISPGTAKVHVRHILDKVGARTRAEAAARTFDHDP